jgi:hypothetical protein
VPFLLPDFFSVCDMLILFSLPLAFFSATTLSCLAFHLIFQQINPIHHLLNEQLKAVARSRFNRSTCEATLKTSNLKNHQSLSDH